MAAMYRALIGRADKLVPAKFQPLWNHPAGPKTVFFWAPSFKWGLVIAGLGDLTRPAEKLSFSQSAALAATGTIWSSFHPNLDQHCTTNHSFPETFISLPTLGTTLATQVGLTET
ncbi:Mitochondrial pyruvate carrier 2 [Chionoecetes opilio]|uniref:Mitochondrial pyruvate carrier n=1 Tax=Chionoecetes opilio TaxID=41210 RepID=A0A8J4YH70_CHIOP|nr:Mitochondrial pyruvate carrier 2 [Chionoecetes opilio]